MKAIESQTDAPVFFGKVPTEHWSMPDWINRTAAEITWDEMEKAGVKYGKSESYR